MTAEEYAERGEEPPECECSCHKDDDGGGTASITASADGSLPKPDSSGEINLGTIYNLPEHGHANWKIDLTPEPDDSNLVPFANKVYGFAGIVGLAQDAITGRGLKDFENFLINGNVYRKGLLAFLGEKLKPNQHKFEIEYNKAIKGLEAMKQLEADITVDASADIDVNNPKKIYNLFDYACADACIDVLNKCGIAVDKKKFRKTVKGTFSVGFMKKDFSEDMTIPQLLGEWLKSQNTP